MNGVRRDSTSAHIADTGDFARLRGGAWLGRRVQYAFWLFFGLLHRGGIFGVAIIIGLVCGASLAAFPPSGSAIVGAVSELKRSALARPELRVRWVKVIGTEEADPQSIVDAMGLDETNRSALAFDAERARRRVEALGWVEKAEVTLAPPQTVIIRVEERLPAALWRFGSQLAALDVSGAVIAPITKPEEMPENWVRLPLLLGDGAPEAMAAGRSLFETAESAGLAVAAITRIGRRRWDLELIDGMRVMLPEKRPQEALSKIVYWARNNGLLRRGIAILDMRLEHMPTARLAEGSALVRIR